MNVIWKTVLQPGTNEVSVPQDAELLCAREQHDEVCIWFRCDPNAPKKLRTIATVMTDSEMPEANMRYLGLAALKGGSLIVHVFELNRADAATAQGE